VVKVFPGKEPPGAHRTVRWLGPRVGLKVLEKEKENGKVEIKENKTSMTIKKK
jgi:hypothetical protein